MTTLRARATYLAPLLLAALFAGFTVAATAFRPMPLGDDWIFFSHFDHIPLLPHGDAECAVLANATAADGLRFRPLAYAHMWTERRLSSSFAWNWAIGLAYLGACGSALALLLTRLGTPRISAILAGALLVLHPAQCEVWGWASARIDTMATAFGLLALALSIGGRRVIGGIAFLAALLCKESAYPLVVLPPLWTLLQRRGLGAAARASAAPLAALAIVVGLKLALVGKFFASSWGNGLADIPLGVRIAGYASVLRPLLFDPISIAAKNANWLGVLFVGLLGSALIVGLIRRRAVADSSGNTRVVTWLLAAFGVSIVVTFGVPVRPDLAGGRVWLLPAAFLLGCLARISEPWILAVALLPSAAALHANLAPYRVATQDMRSVVDRVLTDTSDRDAAIRISDLEAVRWPVPLFAIMTNYAHELLQAPHDQVARALLTRDDQAKLDPAGIAKLDRLWRSRMRAAGKHVTAYRWNRETRTLERRRRD